MESSRQLVRGIVLALAAAVAFGITAPLLAKATVGLGALGSGGFLYLGASGGALLLALFRGRWPSGTLLHRRALSRLVMVALLGGALAPALLILGLQRVNAATGALLLVLEAPFTLLLARLLLREYVGPRVLLAAALILAGGLLIASPSGASGQALGAALVAAATLAWAGDNLLSRTLADQDPLGVVALKGALGALASGVAAGIFGEALPAPSRIAALLAIGAFGYGVSLQLYLRAQSLIGAGRTASVFAAGPFFGAIAALLLGAPWPGWSFPAAAALMIGGVALHLSERHQHRHTHAPVLHEHLHRHDDGHHDHQHDPMPVGPHSHPHQHVSLTHEHEHSEDLHHRHPH